MIKLISVLIICFTWAVMSGVILNVAVDGSEDYLSIQSAIDASANTDTVLVYPGRYYENIRFYGKNITLASLELITGNRDYMYSTIIDGNQANSVIQIRNGESNVTIRGFSIVNGYGYYDAVYGDRYGGGLLVGALSGDRILNLINCLISDNFATNGGGMQVSRCHFYMSGVTVKNNRSSTGGGIFFSGSGTTAFSIDFDPVNRCNIYSNYASFGSDMYYYDVNSATVVVDTFTVANPWNFYATAIPRNSQITNPFTFDILHTVHEEVNHDLYVATWGDDSNSGLSPSDPMKSVFMAMYRIASDSGDPKTVHVANGMYSATLNDQLFPLTIKSHTRLVGESRESTIFDAGGGGVYDVICMPAYNEDWRVSSVTLTNGEKGISDNFSTDFEISDVLIGNLYSVYSAEGFFGSRNTNSKLSNVIITNVSSPESATGINCSQNYGKFVLNDVEISNCSSGQWMPTLDLSTRYDIEVILNRCTFFGNRNNSPDIFNTIMQIAPFGDYGTRLRVEIKDSAFYDNYQAVPSLMGMVRALNDTLFITNCTFAGNSGGSSALAVQGTSVLINNIFWNPALPTEVYIPNNISSDIHSHTTLSYNNIRNGMSGVVNATSQNPLIWGEGNTIYDPLFTLQGNNPYTLSADSPLIDTGWQYSSGLAEPELDAGGNERLWDGDGDGYSVIDKGAYEYQMLYAPANLNAVVSGANVWLDWAMPITERSLTGYRIYRNGAVRADINDPGLMAFRDHIAQTDTLIYAVVALYGDVESAPSNEVSVVVVVGNDDDVNIPERDYLLATPNPFSALAVLRLGLEKTAEINLEIFNLRGQKVTTISQGRLDKGEHVLFWDGKDEKGCPCSNGVYVLRLSINGKQVNTRKITYIN